MDSEKVIPALIVLTICFIPIFIMKVRSVSKKRRVIRSLYKLVGKSNETVFQTGSWNNSAIGLTKNGSYIFVVSENKMESKHQAIHLPLFNNCKLVNDNSRSPYKEGNFKVTEKIELELTGANKATESICFYNRAEDGDILTDELQLAEIWCKKINENMTNKT